MTDKCDYQFDECHTHHRHWAECEVESLRSELAKAKADIARKESERQYHMDAINRIAKAFGCLGETSMVVAEKAEAALKERERVIEAGAVLAQAVRTMRANWNRGQSINASFIVTDDALAKYDQVPKIVLAKPRAAKGAE